MIYEADSPGPAIEVLCVPPWIHAAAFCDWPPPAPNALIPEPLPPTTGPPPRTNEAAAPADNEDCWCCCWTSDAGGVKRAIGGWSLQPAPTRDSAGIETRALGDGLMSRLEAGAPHACSANGNAATSEGDDDVQMPAPLHKLNAAAAAAAADADELFDIAAISRSEIEMSFLWNTFGRRRARTRR